MKAKIDTLLKTLSSGDDFEKIESAFELAKFNLWSGVDFLLATLNHPNWERRSDAINYLGQIGVFKAIDPIGDLITKDTFDEVRREGIHALQVMGYTEGVSHILKALKDDAFVCREDARIAVYRLLGEEVLPLLDPEEEMLIEDDYERKQYYLSNAEIVNDWWSNNYANYSPGKVYFFGNLITPIIFLNKISHLELYESDAYWAQLEVWTGQYFGEPSKQMMEAWKSWITENSDKYIPGVRYFWGHLVRL